MTAPADSLVERLHSMARHIDTADQFTAAEMIHISLALTEAAARIAALEKRLEIPKEAEFAHYDGIECRDETIRLQDNRIAALEARSRWRALRRDRIRGRESTLTANEIRALCARANGRCEATGIPFSLDKREGTFRRPFAPSIDRLDNAAGYSFSNCRLIALAVNIGINEWGESVFRRIALGFLVAENGTLDGHTVPRETVTD